MHEETHLEYVGVIFLFAIALGELVGLIVLEFLK